MGICMLPIITTIVFRFWIKTVLLSENLGRVGTAPGQLSYPTDVVSLPDGRIVVVQGNYSNYNPHYFQADGTFLKRVEMSADYYQFVSVGQDGMMFSQGSLYDSEGEQISYIGGIDTEARTCFTHEGDLIESYNGKLRCGSGRFGRRGCRSATLLPSRPYEVFPKGRGPM